MRKDMSDNVTILSWPSSCTSILSLTVLLLAIRGSYVMGESSRDKKAVPMSSYWALCASLVLLFCLWSVIKFVD